jgi:uncharacterized 2Fe-2S/4Fe-4S cluster protein (DUF4445 family)
VPSVTFLNEQRSTVVEEGTTILEAARRAGIIIEAPCNAIGNCGKCKVQLPNKEHRTRVSSLQSSHTFTREEKDAGLCLSCQTIISGDIEVSTKDNNEENNSLQILEHGNSFDYEISPYIHKEMSFTNGAAYTEVYGGDTLLGIEEGDTRAKLYAIALDIGTTTIVASIVDLQSGKQLAVESELNPQAAYAQDVLSRIHLASKEEGLRTLHSVFIECLNRMIDELSSRVKIDKSQIYEIVFSGNTTMLHLAANINPYSLGQYPYVSKIEGNSFINAKDLQIAISEFGLIYLPPIISAYVGADITSGILVSRLDEAQGTVLFIDIGTNGEIALAKDGKIAASSTAAGPAFEGMNISCGMRAAKGAIESFTIGGDGRYTIKTIGGGEAIGICGSGLLDIVGEYARLRVISTSGRLIQKEIPIISKVFLTQKDVRQVQLAKSAIRTGIEMLLSSFALSAHDITRVEIAGSFGYHLNENSLINIGLLPKEFKGKVYFTGNTSLSGAVAFLLNKKFMEKMSHLVKEVNAVDLAKHENFDRMFIANMGF